MIKVYINMTCSVRFPFTSSFSACMDRPLNSLYTGFLFILSWVEKKNVSRNNHILVQFSDFFNQSHDWMLPTVDQADLTRFGYADIGYLAPTVMETKQSVVPFPSTSSTMPQSDMSIACSSGFPNGKRKSQE